MALRSWPAGRRRRGSGDGLNALPPTSVLVPDGWRATFLKGETAEARASERRTGGRRLGGWSYLYMVGNVHRYT